MNESTAVTYSSLLTTTILYIKGDSGVLPPRLKRPGIQIIHSQPHSSLLHRSPFLTLEICCPTLPHHSPPSHLSSSLVISEPSLLIRIHLPQPCRKHQETRLTSRPRHSVGMPKRCNTLNMSPVMPIRFRRGCSARYCLEMRMLSTCAGTAWMAAPPTGSISRSSYR